MSVVHLTPRQRQKQHFHHPMLDKIPTFQDETADALIQLYVEQGWGSARDSLMACNYFLVKALIGRYLYYWPVARTLTHDLVSEGLFAVVEVIGSLDRVIPIGILRAMIIVKAKIRIETYLNDNRCIFGAALRTNLQRQSIDEDAEYIYAAQLNENLVAGKIDPNFSYVDIRDDIEILKQTDKEEFIDRVLFFMDNYPHLLQDELSGPVRDVINEIATIVGESNG